MFWKARVAFASAAYAGGALGVARSALGFWAQAALAGGFLAGARHLRHLRSEAPGFPWLLLPLSPDEVLGQLRWESRLHSWWPAPAAPAVLAAMVGLVPWWGIPVGAAVAFASLWLAGAVGCAIAEARAAARARGPRVLPRVLRGLAYGTRADARTRAGRGVAWQRAPVWRALWRKDLLLAFRPTAARRRLVAALLLAAASFLVWQLTLPPMIVRIGAFALALAAAGVLGEWIIALSAEDPFAVLRGLPVGVKALWLSRFLWALLGALLLAGGHLALARGLTPEARELFAAWAGLAALAIGTLAVNYGITLFPRAAVAQRLFALALGIAIAASLMIPLLGWATLLAGLVHSTRRLTHWSRLDETAA